MGRGGLKMKPIFILCDIPRLTVDARTTIVNPPVNIMLCTTLHCSNKQVYSSDGEKGLSIDYPSITFKTFGTDIVWTYKNSEDRNKQFESILTNFS